MGGGQSKKAMSLLGNLLVDTAKRGNLRMLQRIAKRNGVNMNHQHTKSGQTALVELARAGNLKGVRIVLMQNANVNATDAHGQTALMAALNKNRLPVVELLLHMSPDYTLRDDQGRTCLTFAAQAGRAELIKKLLEEEPGFKETIDVLDFQGRSPLLWAARQGHSDVVGILLEHNADPTLTDKFDKDAQDYAAAGGYMEIAKMVRLGTKGLMIIRTDRFIDAAERGDVDTMDDLLKKEIDIHRVHTSHGSGAIHKACEVNNVAVIDKLLKIGCQIEAKTKIGWTPIIVAALHDAVDAVLHLMEKGANMRATNSDGETPFQIAAKYGFPRMLRSLFESGGVYSMPKQELDEVLGFCHRRTKDMFKKVYDYIIAHRGDNLVNAAEKGDIWRLERLITIYGADPNHAHTSQPAPPEGTKPMYHGRTALIAAAEYGHGECAVKLLKLGAEISLTDKRGETALQKACYFGHTDTVGSLLLDGADIHERNPFTGKTPLHYAADGNQDDTVKALLKYGADPNAVSDRDKLTPIMSACLTGSDVAVRALMECGADPTTRDAYNNTALILAAGNGKDECVRTLLSFNVDIRPENMFGRNAFQSAVWKQRVGCVRLLLDASMQLRAQLGDMLVEGVQAQDRKQVRDALHYGAYVEHRHTATGLRALDVANTMNNVVILELLRGANRTQAPRFLGDAMVDACAHGVLPQVRRTVEYNDFNPEYRVPSSGMSALCAAAQGGHLEVATYLLDKGGCDIEGKTKYDGRTPLIYAAIGGQVDMAQMLLSRGAKPRNIDMMGLTALDYAEMEGQQGVLAIMKAVNRTRLWALRAQRRLRNKVARGEAPSTEDVAEFEAANAGSAAIGRGEVPLDAFEPDDVPGGVGDEDADVQGPGSPSAFAKAMRALRAAGQARAARRESEARADSEQAALEAGSDGDGQDGDDGGPDGSTATPGAAAALIDQDAHDTFDDACLDGGLEEDVTVRSAWATAMLNAAPAPLTDL